MNNTAANLKLKVALEKTVKQKKENLLKQEKEWVNSIVKKQCNEELIEKKERSELNAHLVKTYND